MPAVLAVAHNSVFDARWSSPAPAVWARFGFALAAFLVGVIAAETISADETSAPRHVALPEQILTESITDLDAVEPGETEFALNTQTLGAATGGARARQASVEAEWRATSHLGLRLEPSYASLVEEGRSQEFGLQGALAWALVRDIKHDFYMQAEATGRVGESDKPFEAQPGDFSLPFTAGIRTGFRFGNVTIRPGAGVEAGAAAAHAPIWGGVGVLYALGQEGRLGFFGLEMDADAGRRTPFIVAPNFLIDTQAIGLPFRVGIALPWVVGAAATEPLVGLYFRVLVRTEVD